MALTELQVRQAKPKEKPYMVRDDNGLYLEVIPAGGKYWRLRYWVEGKEKKISLGVYPMVSLKEARAKRDEFKKNISEGIDPRKKKATDSPTFEDVAREWFSKRIHGVRTPRHAETVISRLERFLFPSLGLMPIKDITTPELLSVLRAIEARGIIETAHRVKQIAGQVFRYGIAIGVCDRDLSADLRDALPPNVHDHHASLIDPQEIAGLLRAMGAFGGSIVVKHALWFSAYTFARPGEVRHAEWKEFNLRSAEWRIPAEKMKKRRMHIVPLSKQVLEIMEQLKPITGQGQYVFPSIRTVNGSRPMSENTITAALRRMGFTNKEMTAHGFRSMASTLLHEQGWSSDAIERQLAHVEGNSVKAAYNYAQHLDERRKMMQSWADWLDALVRE